MFRYCYSTLVVAFSVLKAVFLLFIWLFFNLKVREQTLVPCFASRFNLYRTDIREDANTHKVISYKYLSNSICTVVEEFCQPDFCLWRFFFSTYFYLVIDGLRGWSGFLVSVCGARSSLSCPKLHWSPFEHWSFFLPLVTHAFSSFNANQALSTLDHCSCFEFPVSEFLIYTSLSPSSSISDNWASISFDESPCRTILIQF